MRAPVVALLPVALTAAVALGQSTTSVRIPDNPLQGRILFENRQCVTCHSIAAGSSSIGPRLGEGEFAGTFLDLGAQLWNHVPGMSVTFESAGYPWPQLDDGEVVELVSFLYFTEYLGRPGAPDDGRRLFQNLGCATCHAVGGGPARVGPDLADLPYFASPVYVAQQIWNHGPAMMESMRERGIPVPVFGEGDLADLSAYIRQAAGPSTRGPLLAAPGNPNQGRVLFSSKRCAVCHGTSGRGGDGGPDLTEYDLRRSAEAVSGLMWNHSLGMRDAMAARGIGWPQLVDSDLADLVAFLYFLPFEDPPGSQRRGEGVYTSKACSSCHEEPGEAIGSDRVQGPELTGSMAAASPAALVAAMWNHAPVMKQAILREGRAWPELTGQDLRDLLAYLRNRTLGR